MSKISIDCTDMGSSTSGTEAGHVDFYQSTNIYIIIYKVICAKTTGNIDDFIIHKIFISLPKIYKKIRPIDEFGF